MSDDFGLAKPFTHKCSAGGSKSPVCSKQSPWSISSCTAGIQLSHGDRVTLPNTALPQGKVSNVGLHPTRVLSPGSIFHMARPMDGGWGEGENFVEHLVKHKAATSMWNWHCQVLG